MSEKSWRRFYLYLMLFIYIIYAPISIIEWLSESGGFPFTAIIVGIALPLSEKSPRGIKGNFKERFCLIGMHRR
ncbi:hypothetical protein GCM10008934_22160 [Virgibacillus salarius]